MIDGLPLESRPDPETYELRCGNFFDLDETEKFDFIYDYTFFW